jgi:hypothetical protein
MHTTQATEGSYPTHCLHGTAAVQIPIDSSHCHATPRLVPRSTPQMFSLPSPDLRGSRCLAALTYQSFLVTQYPHARMYLGMLWLSLARLYHPNLICCALHWRYRSAHAAYRVSHLAWPSIRALWIKRVYCYQKSALYNTSQPLNREEASGVWGRFQRRASCRSIGSLDSAHSQEIMSRS